MAAAPSADRPFEAVVLVQDLAIGSLSLNPAAKQANKDDDGAGNKGYALWINALWGATRRVRFTSFPTWAVKPYALPKPGQSFKPWEKLLLKVNLSPGIHDAEISALKALDAHFLNEIFKHRAHLGSISSLGSVDEVKGVWRKRFLVQDKDGFRTLASISGWGKYIGEVTTKDWTAGDGKVVKLLDSVEFLPRWVDEEPFLPKATTRFFLRLEDDSVTHQIPVYGTEAGTLLSEPRMRRVGPQDIANGCVVESADIDLMGFNFGSSVTHKATVLNIVLAWRARRDKVKAKAPSDDSDEAHAAGAGGAGAWASDAYGLVASKEALLAAFKPPTAAVFSHVSLEVKEEKDEAPPAVGEKRARE